MCVCVASCASNGYPRPHRDYRFIKIEGRERVGGWVRDNNKKDIRGNGVGSWQGQYIGPAWVYIYIYIVPVWVYIYIYIFGLLGYIHIYIYIGPVWVYIYIYCACSGIYIYICIGLPWEKTVFGKSQLLKCFH